MKHSIVSLFFAPAISLALALLLAPTAARAQYPGEPIDVCNSGVLDSTYDIEQTVCIFGDVTQLWVGNDIEVYNGNPGGFYQVDAVNVDPNYIWALNPQTGGRTLLNANNNFTPTPCYTYEVWTFYDYTLLGDGNIPYYNVPGLRVDATVPTGVSGYINLKYVVADVIYSPPGSQSYVSYSNSTTVSNTLTVVNTITTSNTKVSVTSVGGLFGYLGGSRTKTQSTTLTQQNQDTQSVTLSDTNTNTLAVYGPGNGAQPNDPCGALASDYIGLDHDCDTIRVWLNPVMLFTVYTDGEVVWNGYGSDANDPVAPIHIDDVKVGCLNGDLAQNSSVCSSFFGDIARTWAGGENWPSGQGPGLTAADLTNILSADPWGNCTPTSPIGSSACPTYSTPGFALLSPNFYLSEQENIPYQQGGLQTTYTVNSTQSSMQGQESTSTYSQTYGYESSFKGSGFFTGIGASFGSSQTITTSNEVNNQATQSGTFIGTAYITGPACTGYPCNPSYPPGSQYYGQATQFDIFTDQFYGTFAFVPSDYY
jgi:hypothetical protein